MATATLTKLKNFIDGETVDAGRRRRPRRCSTRRPASRSPRRRSRAPRTSTAPWRAARRAFETWSRTTPRERSERLLALAQLFDDHAEELAAIESAEAGKPIAIGASRRRCRATPTTCASSPGAARLMEGKAAGEYVENRTSMIRREPVGVVGQITPWNYPLSMAVWKIGPALATGNTIVLKPAENTPMGTLRMAELAADIFPPGVLNVIGGHGEPAGAALVRHPDVDMISLTGSPGTGKWIAREAADTLKRVHLELGRQGAGDRLRRRRHGRRGRDDRRRPASTTRARTAPPPAACWPRTAVYDDVVNGLADQAKGYVMGDTSDDRHDARARSSRQAQRERVEGFLERRGSHAEIVTGGLRARPARVLPRAHDRRRPASRTTR